MAQEEPEVPLTATCGVVRIVDDDFCEFRVQPIGPVSFQVSYQPSNFAVKVARFWAGDDHRIELHHEPNATTEFSRKRDGRYTISSSVESSGTYVVISENDLRAILEYIATLPVGYH